MERYYPYDPLSTVRVEESLIVKNSHIVLRHIPKQGSIVIDGFAETESVFPEPYQFSCDYSVGTAYREANRVLNFNAVHNGDPLTINYIAIGTVFTADDANEIKAHLENSSIHGGNSYTLPTASKTKKGGVMVGDNLYMQGDTLHAAAGDNFFHNVGTFVCFPYVIGNEDSWNVADCEEDFQSYAGRPSKNYDLVNWGNTGSSTGWAIRIDDKWINLGTDIYDAQWQLENSWQFINPLLSIKDRQKLDAFDGGDGLFRFVGKITTHLSQGEFDTGADIVEEYFQANFGRLPRFGDIVYLENESPYHEEGTFTQFFFFAQQPDDLVNKTNNGSWLAMDGEWSAQLPFWEGDPSYNDTRLAYYANKINRLEERVSALERG